MFSAAYIWAKVLGCLETTLGEILVQTWFDDAEAVALTEEQFILYSPSDFRQEKIIEHFLGHIRDALRTHQIHAEPIVWGEAEYKAYREQTKSFSAFTYNPRFTFSNYIAGSSNTRALKIAMAAANDPGQELFNPLFFYGPPGVGKTHLLYAIANSICSNMPEVNVIYVKAEQFTCELVEAIRDHNTAQFRSKYRTADVLLIDDIQFISGKEATQEEFFHTFNELIEQRKQIVMTADRVPADMITLENRLRTRFGEGIMVDIVPPDHETRLLILRSKAAALGLGLSEDIYDYLASQLTDNVRQIEGALKKIRAFHSLDNMALTIENIARTINDLRTEDPVRTITPELVINAVCRYYHVEEEQLMSPLRAKNIALPRQVAIYLSRKLAGLSFPELGRVFNRDNSTINYGLKKISALLRSPDTQLFDDVKTITEQLTAGK
ncbi:MAG: chromosomal replication initiator protein DnaA [Oscillospiraceae bacterium]|nr:chromosomal replication initiator protein DnaA [Oscillospiraceae bacterium]